MLYLRHAKQQSRFQLVCVHWLLNSHYPPALRFPQQVFLSALVSYPSLPKIILSMPLHVHHENWNML